MILFRYARLELHPAGCTTRFQDGTSVDAIPHTWDHHYSVIAHRCGYGDDLLAYCREHEACHLLIGEWFFDGPSRVLWELAHGRENDPLHAALEEIGAQALQRFLRANERPIVGGVDWSALKNYALSKLGEKPWGS